MSGVTNVNNITHTDLSNKTTDRLAHIHPLLNNPTKTVSYLTFFVLSLSLFQSNHEIENIPIEDSIHLNNNHHHHTDKTRREQFFISMNYVRAMNQSSELVSFFLAFNIGS